MPDRRPVDQVSTEELERILAIRKRQERAQRLRRLAVQGRIAPVDPLAPPAREPGDAPASAGQSSGRYRSVDLDQEPEDQGPPRRGLAWGWLFNKFLLVVELAAVAGLIVVGVIWFFSVRETNESVKAVLATPTLPPKPLIDVVVLPSGHRPPTSPGGEAA